jgi:glucuronate isomerase
MSRRCDASYLARLVVEHRISDDQAGQIIRDLVTTLPRKVFSRTGGAS